MKSIMMALILVFSTANAFGAAAYEPGIDRPGSDYLNFDLAPGTSACECLSRCLSDPRCKAYTYVEAGYQSTTNPRCWLKNAVPNASPNPCCTSGYIY